MPQKRKPEHSGLPTGWRWKNGAYRYRVPEGMAQYWDGKREFTLGARLPDAYKVWSERLGSMDAARTVGQLLDRYQLEVEPEKAATTQAANRVLGQEFESLRAHQSTRLPAMGDVSFCPVVAVLSH